MNHIMPRDREARRFWRVGLQRMEDAKILTDNDRWRASIYLAGYAIECTLKALILSRTPVNHRDKVLGNFRGSRAHSLEWLHGQLIATKIALGTHARKSYLYLSSWDVSLRYDPGQGDPTEAKDFLDKTEVILIWISERIE